MHKNISQLLTIDQLRKSVGEPSYSRGKEYFEEGRVKNIEIDDERIYAKVHGSRVYRVELWQEKDKLEYSCTCPFHQDNKVFCKHCVAVALAFLESKKHEEGALQPKETQSGSPLKIKDVETYLESQDKTTLIAMLMQSVKKNEELRSDLYLKASKSENKISIPTFKREIDRAVDSGDYVDYKSMYEYSEGIEKIIESLDDLLHEGHALAVIEISEYFLKSLEAQMDMVDDSDGAMSDILTDTQELHYKACVKVKPDPEQLARKLFDWELHSEWEVFYGASTRYAGVLGKKGLSVYAELAEKEWVKIPALKPGQERESFAGNRYRITSIMEALASKTKDVEKLVAVKKKDLSHAYSYLTIAEIYKEAGKRDKALEWAEEGVRVFPKRTDSRLRKFLAKEYHWLKRHDDAMQLIWAEVSDSPQLEKYKLLKIHAEQAGGHEAWGMWREKALPLIRDRIKESKRKARSNQWIWNSDDRSELVRIYLWEKDIDVAWREAQEGGCHESLWRELAVKRENDHPEDALTVYRSLVEPIVRQMNNEAYRDASALVKKIGVLFGRLGKVEEWNNYLADLRTTHKKKRNFMALLEKIH
ncbi:MAG: SWIM zinc finger family protein [bacterium]